MAHHLRPADGNDPESNPTISEEDAIASADRVRKTSKGRAYSGWRAFHIPCGYKELLAEAQTQGRTTFD